MDRKTKTVIIAIAYLWLIVSVLFADAYSLKFQEKQGSKVLNATHKWITYGDSSDNNLQGRTIWAIIPEMYMQFKDDRYKNLTEKETLIYCQELGTYFYLTLNRAKQIVRAYYVKDNRKFMLAVKELELYKYLWLDNYGYCSKDGF